MIKTKKAMAVIMTLIIATMVFTGLSSNVFAADPQLISGDFKHPAEGVRLDGMYSGSFDKTTNSVISVEKGTIVNNDNVKGIFENFDRDYNANRIDKPDSKYDGFMNGNNPIVSNYTSLYNHVIGNGEAKWYMFNLADNTKGNIKIKVEKLKYYNGRDKKYENVAAVITITDWNKATSGSALVDDIVVDHQSAWDERGNNYRYGTGDDKTPDWKKSPNGTTPAGKPDYKHEYQRPDSDPYVIVSITDSGLPGIRIARLDDLQYKVEFFESGTNTAKKITSNVSATDIDVGQKVTMTPGGSDNVDYYAVSPNTNFKTPVYENGKFSFEDAKTPYEERDNFEGDAFALYYSGTQYSMRYRSGHKGSGGYSYFAQQSAPSVYYTPHAPYKTIGWTGENNDTTHDRAMSTRTSKGITENMTEAQKWAKVRSLTRDDLVSNTANTEGNNAKQSTLKDAINTLFNKKITFKICHVVGNDYNDYNKFSKYRIKDTFDPAFELITTGEDAPKMSGKGSDNFTVTTNGQYVEANANDPKADSLYGSEHILVVKAYLRKEMFDLYGGKLKISDYINSEGRLIAVPNTAQVVIDDGGPAWTAGQTEDSSLNQFVKSTDTTFATVVMPKPKKENLEKYVADADNRKLTGKGTTAVGDGYKEIYDLLSPGGLTENTLDNPVDEYTYYVAQTLNPGYTPYWYFKSFEVSDSVANQPLTIVSAKMHRLNWSKNGEQVTYTRPANSDASDAFKVDIAGDKKSVKATAYPASLNSSAFYRPGTGSDGKSNRYVLEIKVKIDKSQYNYKPQIDKWFDDAISAGESKGYTWKNTANVKITDNYDPDLTQNSEEQAAASWDKNSNETKTHIFAPRFDVTKTAHPYEFQVGDDIPYTIKIKNIEQNTTAGWVEGVDSDFPDGYTIKDIKATGGTQPNAKFENKKLLMEALKLPYNQELVTTFKAVPDKTLNGKVVPNTAYARAWGIEQDADHTKWAAKASTSVYINSPKLDITKTPDKKPDADGKIRVVKGDSIRFTTKIKNVNPGTFMRNLYAVDVVETDGLSIKPESISVRVNSGTDSEEMVSVDKLKGNRMAYIVEPFKNGENTVPIKKGEDSDYMNGKLGSKEYNKYPIETSDKKAENTGDQLPKSSHGGFVIKFLGKYRNMGYQDKTIPATSDNVFDKVRNKVGKDVTYMPEAMRAVEADQTEYGSSPYTKDYDNLNLQNLIEITYECEVTEDGLEEIANFIRVPATENTNNDMINNDDSIPSGGDFANTSETVVPDDPEGDPDKSVKEEVADKDAELHYTVSGENTGQPMIKTPVLEDELVTKNLVFDKDSFEVFRNEANDDNKLSSDKYSIEFDDENYKFTVTVPDANLKTGEKIIVTYSGTVTKDIKTTNPKNRRVQDLTEEEVVHNKVKFCGKYAHVWTPNTEPENTNPRLTKSVKEKTTQKGGTLHYTVVGENVSGIAARQVVFNDKIKTKNFDYDKDSFRIVFTSGKTKQDTDLTEELNSKIQFEKDSFKLETGKDLEKGDKITITYSGKVRGDKEAEPEDQASDEQNNTDDPEVTDPEGQEGTDAPEGTEPEDSNNTEGTEEVKSVDNVVVMTGSNFDALQDEETVPFGDPDIEKTARQTYTEKGKKIDYDANFTNTNDEVWRNVVLKDEITSKNAEYNKDFKIYIDGKDITGSCSFEYGEFKVTIKTGKDLAKGQKISATYSVTTTNGKWLDNKFITEDADGRNAVAFESVPPVTHEKDVKESEHDGPEGIRNTLHYTLTSKHNDDERPLKNVVITDEVLSKNLTFNDDIKVVKGDKDITGDCNITMAADKMSFEIKLKDPLEPGETIITTYSGNVKDRSQVDNETVLRADGIDGIKDDEHVPGPGDGEFMTVYKDSDPVTDSKVNPGQTITYILKAVNTGKDTVKFGRIRDYIPEGTTFESVQNGGVFVKDKNYCEWILKDIKPGEENAQTVTFKVKVNTVNVPKEIFNHALYQSYKEKPGNPGSPSLPDPSLKTRYVRHYTTLDDPDPRTILVGKKSSDPVSGTPVKVGDKIKYMIEVENQGNKGTESAGVRDYIPDGTKFAKAEDGGKYDAAKNCVDWSGLKIAGKGKITISFTVEVAEKAKELGVVVNQALYQDEWTDPEKDPSSSTNKVEHPLKPTHERIRGKQVTLYKSCKPPINSLVRAGDIITYKLTAKNTGAATSKYTHLRDYIPEGTTFHSVQNNGAFVKSGNYVEWVDKGIKVGKSKSVTFKVKVNENPPKIIRNYALHETFPKSPGKPGKIKKDPGLESNPVQHKTDKDILTDPVIEVIKGSIPKPGTPVKKGDSITYTLKVKNTGESAAKSIVVRDVIPKGTKYISGSANAGGKYTKSLKRLQWVIKTLKAGKSKTLKFKVKVTAKSFKVIKNQAKYDRDFDPKDPKDPKNWSNIVEHPPAPVKHTKPHKAKKPIVHKKSATEKATARGRSIHYTLKTEVRAKVRKVVITDKVTSQNFKYNRKSIKVFFNGKNVTKDVKDISFSRHSFIIQTGMDASKGDKFKVTYSGKTTDSRKVINESAAYGKGIKPVKAKEIVPPDKGAPSPKGRNNSIAKTGDDFKLAFMLGLFALAAVISFVALRGRKSRKTK